ncbi:MAG: integrase core domain-containing protein [Microbacterium sp.]
MESTIGLFKTEVIDHERPTWDNWRQIEQATASWVHWHNTERLHSAIGHHTPTEFEELNYALTQGTDQTVPA